jgi:hypothetical protein
MRQVLQLENVELGGLMSAANDALAEVCKDVVNRPHNAKARTLTIKIAIKPEVTDLPDRRVNQPSIDWAVERAMPGFKGMTTRAFVEGDKVIIDTGNPLGIGDPRQTTIYDNPNA